jgi:hypothetical protein
MIAGVASSYQYLSTTNGVMYGVHPHGRWVLLCPHDEDLPPVHPFVRPSVRPSGYRYMVCPAISSYSFGATALIFFRMFIHIMEVCMSTGFRFSSNILKMTGSWT